MYEHVIRAAMNTPWAILPEKLAMIRDVLARRADGARWSQDEIREQMALMGVDMAAPGRNVARQAGTIAVLPITGVIQNRVSEMAESSGMVGVNGLGRRFAALVANPDVKAIVLDVDSPGGMVYGTPEFAGQVFAAREAKPVIAVADQLAASAAYYIAAAAGELYVSPSGQVGSVGVYSMHVDQSKAMEMEGLNVSLISAGKYKTEGNPFEPLSDEARDEMQREVDFYHDMFVKDLARFRGVSVSAVRADFGQGRVVNAQEAVRRKMADGVRTLDQVIAKLGGSASVGQPVSLRAMQAEDEGEGLTASAAAADIDNRRRRLRIL